MFFIKTAQCLSHANAVAPLGLISTRARDRGFSLVETMVVVAIVAIVSAIAAPSFVEMIRNNRLSAATSALQSSLNLARSEAIKRGSDARVTVAANGIAGNWANGWTVFDDKTTTANGGVGPADDTSGQRLEVVGVLSGPVSSSQTNATLNYFTYSGQGRLIDVTGGTVVNRSFWFFDSTSDKYCLIINKTGRVRFERVGSAAFCVTE